MVKQFKVYLINLDPTIGTEIKKTRPSVIIFLNEMHGLNTIIIAPLASTCKIHPIHISVSFERKEGYIVLDQIRTVDKSQLVKLLGKIEKEIDQTILVTLPEMFA